jgi:putative ABC transport system permease protein
MFDYDKWQEIFQSLKRHKVRTMLTALAVWWGIFMLVILLGAGNGLQNSFNKNFADDALNSIWIFTYRTTLPYKGLKPGRWIRFHNDDYEMLENEVEGVEHITGRYYVSNRNLTEYKGKALQINIRSVHAGHQFLENTIMTKGRHINDRDVAENRKVCIVGEIAREELMGKSDKSVIGEYLTIKGTKFKIVGEFTDEGSDREKRHIYLPITTAQGIFGKDDMINQLMLTVGDATKEETLAMVETIRAKIATKHKFDIKDDQAIYVRARIEEYEQFQTIFKAMQVFIWFVGVGSILAGVVAVSNIMLITVKDRTKEIGIRKALGATPRSIVTMVMQEAIFLTSIAGYIGLLSGFSIIYGLNYFMESNDIQGEYFYNPEVDFISVLAALIFLVVCGTLAGLIPAMQAAKVNPIVAMKS